jgi:hypothetical protein
LGLLRAQLAARQAAPGDVGRGVASRALMTLQLALLYGLGVAVIAVVLAR